jgi:TonB family protein
VRPVAPGGPSGAATAAGPPDSAGVAAPRAATGAAAGAAPGAPPGAASPESTAAAPSAPAAPVPTAIYYPDDVDKEATELAGNPRPRCVAAPDSVAGGDTAVVDFVVDSTGEVDAGTVKLDRSTGRPAFRDSALSTVPRLLFSPAEKGGRKVRQYYRVKLWC